MSRLSGAGHGGKAARAFESGSIPASRLSGRFIGALQKSEQGRLRVARRADCVIRKQKLTERLAEVGGGRLHGRLPEAGGSWIRVRIKCGEVDAVAARPESGAADLVRIGFAHHLRRESRSLARKGRGRAGGEARDREV